MQLYLFFLISVGLAFNADDTPEPQPDPHCIIEYSDTAFSDVAYSKCAYSNNVLTCDSDQTICERKASGTEQKSNDHLDQLNKDECAKLVMDETCLQTVQCCS